MKPSDLKNGQVLVFKNELGEKPFFHVGCHEGDLFTIEHSSGDESDTAEYICENGLYIDGDECDEIVESLQLIRQY